MGERELDGGGLERDAVPLADRGKPLGLRPTTSAAAGRSRTRLPGRGSASMPLFITPADAATPTPRSTQAGSSVAERLLVEQRVAAGEQEHVDVGLADEPGEHRRLVHPGADRAHDALVAQPGERRVGAVDRRLPVIVGVVDVGDVDRGRGPSRSRLASSDRRTPSAL